MHVRAQTRACMSVCLCACVCLRACSSICACTCAARTFQDHVHNEGMFSHHTAERAYHTWVECTPLTLQNKFSEHLYTFAHKRKPTACAINEIFGLRSSGRAEIIYNKLTHLYRTYTHLRMGLMQECACATRSSPSQTKFPPFLAARAGTKPSSVQSAALRIYTYVYIYTYVIF